MEYRREIDGLRAVAVVPVVLFHAGAPFFSGGYIGVDVFFVISGFLITTLILEGLKANSFSYGKFYERRARRILPELIAVCLITVPFSWILLPPSELKDFGESLIAVALYGSNFLFWSESEYFATAAELKPLIHTWSLAIEEQYYLVFPLLASVLHKRIPTYLIYVFIGISIFSLTYSHWASLFSTSSAYFLLTSRAFELMAGSLCAVSLIANPQLFDRLPAKTAIGLALILSCVFLYDKDTLFPGLYALVPVLGTSLIVLDTSTKGYCKRFLQSPPFVGVGLISYSLYLWHQPALAFTHHIYLSDIPIEISVSALVLSTVLATMSWYYIGRPFRDHNRISTLSLWKLVGLFTLALIATGYYLTTQKGHNYREMANGLSYQEIEHRLRPNRGLDDRCNRLRETPYCTYGTRPDTLLWGDSYAMHMGTVIKAGAADEGFYQQTKSSCAPMLNVSQYNPRHGIKAAKSCHEHNMEVWQWLEKQDSIKTVILAANWSILNSTLYSEDGSVASQERDEMALASLSKTVQAIYKLGKNPIIVSPTPSAGYNVGQCVFKAFRLNTNPSDCNFELKNNRNQKTNDSLAKHTEAAIYWIHSDLCPEGICFAVNEETIVFRDSTHLSHEGAKRLGEDYNLYQKLKKMAKKNQ